MLKSRTTKLRTEADIASFINECISVETAEAHLARDLALVLMAENRIRGVFKKGSANAVKKVISAQAKVILDASVRGPQTDLLAKFCKSVLASSVNEKSLSAASSLLERITSLQMNEAVLMDASRLLIGKGATS